ncbi:hypothetical protein SISNIDRAFT_491486 [Sistotremastrum niveocremeum HHB9708]|uniref:T6SS Phospholipase effector Tle1-like catalytic domain-containing protein n=1 Tax=Sistotremastrum niveocremeum HHB9708 TaxID=1314777 RepID=A0A164MQ65_9AGAM|nr:hypothetical protein SISNIDRAFT_491486 [Sistotremastrum niveocremeum HHB9708]
MSFRKRSPTSESPMFVRFDRASSPEDDGEYAMSPTSSSQSHHVTAVDYGDQTEDLEYSGAPATVGGFKLRSRKQPKRQATVYESDATCLPPIMVGRQRTLVLCFDGTGDQFDNDNSNIVNLFALLKKDDKNVQMCYYQAGIGTYATPGLQLPGMTTVVKILDDAVAWYLDRHVKEGYEFLMENYEAGDKICMFGFSRGAYTARALAGMLHKVGLIPACNLQQVPFAWQMYKDNSPMGWEMSKGFKKTFSVDVDIDFLGVFDTVASVGFFGYTLPFTASNYAIRTFRHALALDERRSRFKANYWHQPTHGQDNLGDRPEDKLKTIRHGHESREGHGTSKGYRKADRWRESGFSETDVKEVWFAGCHCDVGGGSTPNETPFTLAQVPLRWMVRECFRSNTGILFDIDALLEIGLEPENLFPEVIVPRPMPTSKLGYDFDHPDLASALSPMFDQLAIRPLWWILEFLPVKDRKQRAKDKAWYDSLLINLGRARQVPDHLEEIHVHRSVKMRMDAMGYTPKARGLHPRHIVWVD